MARRQHFTLMLVIGVMAFLGLTYYMSSAPGERYPTRQSDGSRSSSSAWKPDASKSDADFGLSESILKGDSIAPKLENATIKAELGRATWKLLHTMMARFPEKPTADDSLALKTYITLFSRLYPCGDCAAHFRKLLEKYPPQVSSRNAAAGWACFVHNEVNKRLHKELFDCNKIGDFYDCGCGDEDKNKGKTGKKPEELKGRENMSLEKEEGLTRGG